MCGQDSTQDSDKEGPFIIRGQLNPELWQEIQGLADGSDDDKIKAVELIINRIRELPEDADNLISELSKNSPLTVKRKLAALLSSESEIPWGLWSELIRNLDKENDEEVKTIIKPLVEPYHELAKSLKQYQDSVLGSIPKGLLDEVSKAAQLASQIPLENIKLSTDIISKLSIPLEEIRNSLTMMGNIKMPSFVIPQNVLDSITEGLNFYELFHRNLLTISPSYYPIEKEPKAPQISDHPLISRLRQLPPGQATWVEYQKLSQEILTFCLVPPLLEPLIEEPSRSGIHRRDMIYQIPHDTSGFWEYIRTAYNALAVIVDAKNYHGVLPKDQIVILSKYFSPKKLGNFGLIITRNDLDDSGRKEQEDRWLNHNEMIICLSDDDIIEMISLKLASQEPEQVINRKIFKLRSSL